MVFKWHLAGGRTQRALSAAAANPAPHARAAAAATLLTTLGNILYINSYKGYFLMAFSRRTDDGHLSLYSGKFLSSNGWCSNGV